MTNPNLVKQIYEKHGITKPCPICKDNHVPVLQQERRCRADARKTCVCCGECLKVCDGSVHHDAG